MGAKGEGSRRTELSNSELQLARDMGAATYLSAYIWLMAEQLEIKDLDNESVTAMALTMVDALALSTEATFRALMSDRTGVQDAIRRLQQELIALLKS